jgi:septin family protein
VPERQVKTKLTLMAVGQPETGRTTTLRNLLASLAGDSAFALAAATTDINMFASGGDDAPPITSVTCNDSEQKLAITYNVIVRCWRQHPVARAARLKDVCS